ncbi:hypothetical protein BGY98DRAFT_934333 [Russula aff. rugulosa BPL654]|nr:hypothetical protein BGY98DRAFT_934333 [Russula aff. rugulosa BPL654]
MCSSLVVAFEDPDRAKVACWKEIKLTAKQNNTQNTPSPPSDAPPHSADEDKAENPPLVAPPAHSKRQLATAASSPKPRKDKKWAEGLPMSLGIHGPRTTCHYT